MDVVVVALPLLETVAVDDDDDEDERVLFVELVVLLLDSFLGDDVDGMMVDGLIPFVFRLFGGVLLLEDLVSMLLLLLLRLL